MDEYPRLPRHDTRLDRALRGLSPQDLSVPDRSALEQSLPEQLLLDQPLLDQVFQALADPTRRAMLALLGQGARKVGELAAPFQISLAAASKHIKTLERAGLIQRTVTGRTHLCALDPRPLARALAWLRDGPGIALTVSSAAQPKPGLPATPEGHPDA